MQVFIIAGGKGTRLRPYTTVIPKPLMPLGDMPILEIIIRQLKAYGASNIILGVGYMGHLFEAIFQDGSKHGIPISYSYEDEPLGTAGPIALAFDRLEDDFLVMNGDLLTTMHYGEFFAFHQRQKAAASIAVHARSVKVDFGVLQTAEDGTLEGYDEKPELNFKVSMGINAFSKKVLATVLEAGQRMDIPDCMLKIKAAGHAVHTYNAPCEWLDIGRFDDYESATEVFAADPGRYLGEGA